MQTEFNLIYKSFVCRYPGMQYSSDRITIIHTDPFQLLQHLNQAKKLLGLRTVSSQTMEDLQDFSAETLCNQTNAVILIDSQIQSDNNRYQRIILHELAHLYTRSFLSIEQLKVESHNQLLLFWAFRCRNEYIAQHIAQVVLNTVYVSDFLQCQKEFLGILYKATSFPERFGFFIYRFLHLPIEDRERFFTVPDELLISQAVLQSCQLLKASFCEDQLLQADVNVMHALGNSILSFITRYLEYFDTDDVFIKQATIR